MNDTATALQRLVQHAAEQLSRPFVEQYAAAEEVRCEACGLRITADANRWFDAHDDDCEESHSGEHVPPDNVEEAAEQWFDESVLDAWVLVEFGPNRFGGGTVDSVALLLTVGGPDIRAVFDSRSVTVSGTWGTATAEARGPVSEDVAAWAETFAQVYVERATW